MRDVLLFVSGTTPQIVTETIWGLHKTRPDFRPTEIHVITTTVGRKVLQQRLEAESVLTQLCKELEIAALSPIRFHLIKDEFGEELGDIRNTSHNTALANTIMTVVRSLTAHADSKLHASLSGGRKTMGFYLGYAMSLYARPRDALYHVMVPPEFERSPDFFYPPQVPRLVSVGSGRKLSTERATVEVAEIPFLRLKEWLNEPILNADVIDFHALARDVQEALARPTLKFLDEECAVVIGRYRFKLRPQLYAMYRVLAEARVARLPGAGPDGIGLPQSGWFTALDFSTAESRGTKHFLTTLEGLTLAGDTRYSYVKSVMDREGSATKAGRVRMYKLFNPIFSRLRESLAANVPDPALRREFWVESRGRNPARYGLLADPDQIDL